MGIVVRSIGSRAGGLHGGGGMGLRWCGGWSNIGGRQGAKTEKRSQKSYRRREGWFRGTGPDLLAGNGGVAGTVGRDFIHSRGGTTRRTMTISTARWALF